MIKNNRFFNPVIDPKLLPLYFSHEIVTVSLRARVLQKVKALEVDWCQLLCRTGAGGRVGELLGETLPVWIQARLEKPESGPWSGPRNHLILFFNSFHDSHLL